MARNESELHSFFDLDSSIHTGHCMHSEKYTNGDAVACESRDHACDYQTTRDGGRSLEGNSLKPRPTTIEVIKRLALSFQMYEHGQINQN